MPPRKNGTFKEPKGASALPSLAPPVRKRRLLAPPELLSSVVEVATISAENSSSVTTTVAQGSPAASEGMSASESLAEMTPPQPPSQVSVVMYLGEDAVGSGQGSVLITSNAGSAGSSDAAFLALVPAVPPSPVTQEYGAPARWGGVERPVEDQEKQDTSPLPASCRALVEVLEVECGESCRGVVQPSRGGTVPLAAPEEPAECRTEKEQPTSEDVPRSFIACLMEPEREKLEDEAAAASGEETCSAPPDNQELRVAAEAAVESGQDSPPDTPLSISTPQQLEWYAVHLDAEEEILGSDLQLLAQPSLSAGSGGEEVRGDAKGEREVPDLVLPPSLERHKGGEDGREAAQGSLQSPQEAPIPARAAVVLEAEDASEGRDASHESPFGDAVGPAADEELPQEEGGVAKEEEEPGQGEDGRRELPAGALVAKVPSSSSEEADALAVVALGHSASSLDGTETGQELKSESLPEAGEKAAPGLVDPCVEHNLPPTEVLATAPHHPQPALPLPAPRALEGRSGKPRQETLVPVPPPCGTALDFGVKAEAQVWRASPAPCGGYLFSAPVANFSWLVGACSFLMVAVT